MAKNVDGYGVVFPAQAGMNRPQDKQPPSDKSVPRAGGDEPRAMGETRHGSKCSPRRRG